MWFKWVWIIFHWAFQKLESINKQIRRLAFKISWIVRWRLCINVRVNIIIARIHWLGRIRRKAWDKKYSDNGVERWWNLEINPIRFEEKEKIETEEKFFGFI